MAINLERFIKAKRFDAGHFDLNDPADKVFIRTNAGSAVGNAIAAAIATVDGDETKVNAGANVTVSGTGTAANPYVVNAPTPSGAVLANAIISNPGALAALAAAIKPLLAIPPTLSAQDVVNLTGFTNCTGQPLFVGAALGVCSTDTNG